jgi:DNA-binding MarR family transcriptional regulator
VSAATEAPVPGRHHSARLEDAIAFRIHSTNRLLRTHLSRFLETHAPGLSPEQWFLLARIGEREPVRQVDLAEPVLGDPPNVSRLVDALARRGYVERSPDPADRRSWLLSLTARGRQRTDALGGAAVAERELVFAGFGDEELTAIAAMLDRIDENVRPLLSEPRTA